VFADLPDDLHQLRRSGEAIQKIAQERTHAAALNFSGVLASYAAIPLKAQLISKGQALKRLIIPPDIQ
jgi:uncharacterized protein with PIN domain